MMTEKISVVIPTFRRTKLLINCLDALDRQDIAWALFRVIVVSDGPDPKTQRELQNWLTTRSLQVNFVQMPSKAGPAAARNHGWQMAATPLIAFTDDDCIPDASWLKGFLTRYTGEKMLAFTGKTKVPLPDKKTDFALNIAQLENADFITANCACTRSALEQVGGFDENYKMAWREDSDLEFKLITNRIPILSVPEALVIHPVRTVPWGISVKEQKKGLYDALLFKKFPSLYRRKISLPIWNYYGISVLTLCFIVAIALDRLDVILVTATGLLILFGQLITRRLQHRHKSFSHVLEIIGTSLVIPFVSVFWRLFGSIKYRVLFL